MALIRVSVIDWGIGGVPLWDALRRARPDLQLRYRSDSGRTPWGLLSRSELCAVVEAIICEEIELGAHWVVVACNAASSVLGDITLAGGANVMGVIEPSMTELTRSPWRHIGVLAGKRTVVSRAWASPLRRLGLRVSQRVAQPLSALIERGETDPAITAPLVERLCAPLRQVDVVILGCTHYCALSGLIRAALRDVPLFDPVKPTVAALLAQLPEPRNHTQGQRLMVTSGDPVQIIEATKSAFGVDLSVIPFGAVRPPKSWNLV